MHLKLCDMAGMRSSVPGLTHWRPMPLFTVVSPKPATDLANFFFQAGNFSLVQRIYKWLSLFFNSSPFESVFTFTWPRVRFGVAPALCSKESPSSHLPPLSFGAPWPKSWKVRQSGVNSKTTQKTIIKDINLLWCLQNKKHEIIKDFIELSF